MLLFQIETIAQVKENSKVASYAVEVKFDNLITSKTTDIEIKEIENSFNEDNTLKISNIKRNKEGEIIEIKLEFSSKNNSKYKNIKIVKGDRPIKPIRIFIKEEKNNKKGVGFEEVSNVVSGKYVEAVVETDTNKYTNDTLVKNEKKDKITIFKYSDLNNNERTTFVKSDSTATFAPGTIIYLNDKLISRDEMDKINPNKIKSVDVSKSKSNGEIRIVTMYNNTIEDAEILLDNNVISKEDLNKIDKNEIESINIKKDNRKKIIEIRRKNANKIDDKSLEERKEELAKAKIELEKAKIELEKTKAEIEKLKSDNKK